VPAAAVIPAPIAYIKVVAVKKLVVGSQFASGGPLVGGYFLHRTIFTESLPLVLLTECHRSPVRLL
jgi:hypothetical protein